MRRAGRVGLAGVRRPVHAHAGALGVKRAAGRWQRSPHCVLHPVALRLVRSTWCGAAHRAGPPGAPWRQLRGGHGPLVPHRRVVLR
ncbi:hypothetical protein GZL_07205 [Streptomyces sp. 769]|nr:hypothetical protein GZL_07205 [Streptomyces sp. 769]